MLRRTHYDGSVFILALWVLFFLGALALAVGALVAANIDVAARLKRDALARELANAGVQYAVMEVLRNSTNWNEQAKDPPQDEARFKDNDSLPGGVFSVTYRFLPEGSGNMATNYGLYAEGRKTNINGVNSRTLGLALQEQVGLSEWRATHVAEAIVACRKSPNDGLTERAGSTYPLGSGEVYRCHGGTFKVLHELWLLEAFRSDRELFGKVEPYLTVHGKDCFSGTSTGKAIAGRRAGRSAGVDVLAERRIDFVVNQNGTIVYWHED